MKRIENLDDLKQLMNIWFNVNIEDIINTGNHQITFVVYGKVKTIYESLKKVTEEKNWDISSWSFFYKDESKNFDLYLQSMAKNTLVLATVRDLYKIHLEKFK